MHLPWPNDDGTGGSGRPEIVLGHEYKLYSDILCWIDDIQSVELYISKAAIEPPAAAAAADSKDEDAKTDEAAPAPAAQDDMPVRNLNRRGRGGRAPDRGGRVIGKKAVAKTQDEFDVNGIVLAWIILSVL